MPQSKIDLEDLKPEWKETFIQVHLPWKISQLRAYTKYGSLDNSRRKIGPALGLSTCVAGRMLLEFLGIRLGKEGLTVKEPSEHDICLKHFIPEADDVLEGIDATDRKVLVEFLHYSNKIAHVTYDFRMEKLGKRDGHESIPAAVRIIERLLKHHFYSPLGLEMLDSDDLEAK